MKTDKMLKNSATLWRNRGLGLLLVILPMMVVAISSVAKNEAKKAPAPIKSVKSPLLADEDLKMRDWMLAISRQLGVTCNYCHDVNNFKSDKMPEFKVAKEHIHITEMLSKQGFKGHIKVDCYMCHRGKAKPDYYEK